jgi:hypothetical protein
MGTLVVRKLLILGAAGMLGIFALGGCDPAPSTPIAPDQKLPDTSKMTPAEIEQLHNQGSAGRGGVSAPATGVTHGDTPPDRQLGR